MESREEEKKEKKKKSGGDSLAVGAIALGIGALIGAGITYFFTKKED